MPVTDDQPEPLAKRPKPCDQRSKKCVKISMQTKIDIIQEFHEGAKPAHQAVKYGKFYV